MNRSLVFLFVIQISYGQVANTATTDTANYLVKGRLTVGAYLDAYYGYSFNKPATKDQPYFVSMARHNEMNINLAFVDLTYSSRRVRARIAPGFGTYMNANYNIESNTLKNLVEANAGYRLHKTKNVWIDLGILGSPYTNESAISKDHLLYTRSFAAENVPYYLAGLKITIPLSRCVNAYFFLINGWQQINDLNAHKSIGTQIEVRPCDHLLLNWNTYAGNEQSAVDSVKGLRLFTDLFLIFNKDRWSITSCAYIGHQKSRSKERIWWQANMSGRYAISSLFSVSGRVEYIKDDHGALIVPITDAPGFSSFGTSLCLNATPDTNLLFRIETRYLYSHVNVYERSGFPTNSNLTIVTSVCVWF